jgi:hypothetical protein
MKRIFSNRFAFLSSAMVVALTFAGASRADVISYSGSIVTYTVPATGTYDIIAVGGGGGNGSYNTSGGVGASVEDTFSLTAGEQLSILVGKSGDPSDGDGGGGGGGGTFVIAPGTTPLLIAGGGGGGGGGQVGGSPAIMAAPLPPWAVAVAPAAPATRASCH